MIISFISKTIDTVLDLLKTFLDFLAKLISGQDEIELVCGKSFHSKEMSLQVLNSFKKSRSNDLCVIYNTKIKSVTDIFDVKIILDQILQNRRVLSENKIACSNLKQSLEDINFVNACLVEISVNWINQSYDSNIIEHEESLELLWNELMPGVKREDGRISKEWGLIGFQGVDPSTDFRGMGIFGLSQLIYFAKNKSKESKYILFQSQDEDKGFPFAIVGINITGFIWGLCCDRLLDPDLYNIVARGFEFHDDSFKSYQNSSLISRGIEEINKLYCKIFIEFSEEYIKSSPKNIFDFPPAWDRYQKEYRKKCVQKFL